MSAVKGPVLEARALVKRYPGASENAVDGLSLSVREGICLGLLGPNGAGKTTTVEMMEGILAPDSGQVLYRGEPAGAEFKLRSGIQFQQTALPDRLTVRETLALFSALYPRPAALESVVAGATCATSSTATPRSSRAASASASCSPWRSSTTPRSSSSTSRRPASTRRPAAASGISCATSRGGARRSC
jgi:ABC-type branched-subunit amino acid transport system ATPase component